MSRHYKKENKKIASRTSHHSKRHLRVIWLNGSPWITWVELKFVKCRIKLYSPTTNKQYPQPSKAIHFTVGIKKNILTVGDKNGLYKIPATWSKNDKHSLPVEVCMQKCHSSVKIYDDKSIIKPYLSVNAVMKFESRIFESPFESQLKTFPSFI